MKTAKFQYKCRRCGQISSNPCTNEINAMMIIVGLVNNSPPLLFDVGTTPKMLEIHSCGDKGIGIADLIGYVLIED